MSHLDNTIHRMRRMIEVIRRYPPERITGDVVNGWTLHYCPPGNISDWFGCPLQYMEDDRYFMLFITTGQNRGGEGVQVNSRELGTHVSQYLSDYDRSCCMAQSIALEKG